MSKPTGMLLAAFALLAPLSANAAPPVGRERIQMDAGWRFHRGDLAGAGGVAVMNWRWQPAAVAPSDTANFRLPDPNAGGGWQDVAVGADTFHGRKGFAWYTADVPETPGPNRVLHFENVDDNATVYLNGEKVAQHQGWNVSFDVPFDAVNGANRAASLLILVENTAGAGSVGPVTLVTKQETATTGPAAAAYDDQGWRTLHLPHDFVVEGTFTPTADAGHGSLPTDVGWYRKTFTLPASDKGRSLWLDFDGVYRDSDVWLNGRHLGNHKSGYTGFRYDITNVANYGGVNTLAVRADARAQEGWWYEGGGIYRHVWLNKADPVHIAPQSLHVTPSVRADGGADITTELAVANDSGAETKTQIDVDVLGPDGRRVGHTASSLAAKTGTVPGSLGVIPIASPKLWSLETPTLYRLVVSLSVNGRKTDTVSAAFGIRTIKFDADKGLFLNGKPVKIQGTCNHQDFAGMGIAMPDSLLDWRIRKLKEMGANAYRMSHNPPAPELLDACDRQGMLVMDENRHLGDTYRDHTPSGTPYADLSDLRELILRDRNHPSIIMWSMCNEEGLQGSEEGARIFGAMKQEVLRLDATRPITCAMNGYWGQGISLVEDLQGCNYNPRGYDEYHRRFPAQPAYGSETASAVSSRGEYVNDAVKGYVSAYDVNAPPWAQTAEVAWKALAERDYMAGGYVWTGFDYKGEPTPYGWPCINSHFGIMDICGFPKDTYYYYQAWWKTKPIVHLLPHWNWAGKEGQPINVWCHSNADHVELFLNGVSQGAKTMPRFSHLEWKVPYAAGRLEAKGYDKDGKLVASDIVETTGAATQIKLSTERTALNADGEDVTMVAVSLLDDRGRVVPYADNQVTFQVEGSATIAGVGNGDASSHEPDKASSRKAYHGLCLAVVQAGEQPGASTLTVSAPGLKSATLRLQVKKP